MKSTIYYQYYDSPVGKLLLIANDKGLIGIEFEQEQLTSDAQKWQKANETSGQIFEIFCKTRDILDRYFAGEKLEFRHLDFLAPQGTEFQKSVWQILLTIPYGKTTSYGEIARQLGKPNAMRAVGGAVGRNPISIIVPCHRVLGKSQTLTGFGGGLPAKRYLLALEGIHFKDKGIEFVNPKHKKWDKA
ncbi:putative methylated-DNA--protein-cysteineS-methyltransferase [Actinobacillus pleuropneumoniae]|uniref:Methylated-DNA--protein-cysteine methyltransferase n=2 Tax=Actinobacillus pleuropneumoniae TaxID=715 RepID=A0ABM6X2I0_ACTPL|nr:methylated-DNA--[protein]-cysteine S-methyltransferase [Actinobacillus pleuropneumoniae]ASU16955.1 Methylated-DNA--protein-cysteine methyltransferase [Actinobacillus pleuropneumoniae]AWG95380.1 methylated-DNA--[protein]-cysteine S-methyltransferase [Actinobacillus pleuropneumoniae serovar 1 str. 4074]AXA21451.1 methylated-DNA--[protein]-cysteine S-methyltransferase [Actinobacillus pleuropneumoniae]EFL78369.1 methylated-DNA--protein-cysteine S-methyltransferase [Actinobacillus pleuropneumonia